MENNDSKGFNERLISNFLMIFVPSTWFVGTEEIRTFRYIFLKEVKTDFFSFLSRKKKQMSVPYVDRKSEEKTQPIHKLSIRFNRAFPTHKNKTKKMSRKSVSIVYPCDDVCVMFEYYPDETNWKYFFFRLRKMKHTHTPTHLINKK